MKSNVLHDVYLMKSNILQNLIPLFGLNKIILPNLEEYVIHDMLEEI